MPRELWVLSRRPSFFTMKRFRRLSTSRRPIPGWTSKTVLLFSADKLIPFPRGEAGAPHGRQFLWLWRHKRPRHPGRSAFAQGPRPSRPRQLLLLSAKSQPALSAYSSALAEHLESASPEDFADTAYTFQVGRKQMAQRRFVVAADPHQAAKIARAAQSPELRQQTLRTQKSSRRLSFWRAGHAVRQHGPQPLPR